MAGRSGPRHGRSTSRCTSRPASPRRSVTATRSAPSSTSSHGSSRRRPGRLYPVGRLDRDSEGLLLLTNDGAWAERVLHPRHGVEREYAIAVGHPSAWTSAGRWSRGSGWRRGVEHLRPATLTETRRLEPLLDPRPGRLVWYRGTLQQGWKRQLRRMFAAVGTPVERLVRVRIGTVRLDDVRSGEVRALSVADARRLAAAWPRATARSDADGPDRQHACPAAASGAPLSCGDGPTAALGPASARRGARRSRLERQEQRRRGRRAAPGLSLLSTPGCCTAR